MTGIAYEQMVLPDEESVGTRRNVLAEHKHIEDSGISALLNYSCSCSFVTTVLMGLAFGMFYLVHQIMPTGSPDPSAEEPTQLFSSTSNYRGAMMIALRVGKSATRPELQMNPLRAAAKADSWEFRPRPDEASINVIIPVPPTTKAKDVNVRFMHDRLFVSVEGHASQPFIIDGELDSHIEVAESYWMLEGSGGDRKLFLDIFKKQVKQSWAKLLKESGKVSASETFANTPNAERKPSTEAAGDIAARDKLVAAVQKELAQKSAAAKTAVEKAAAAKAAAEAAAAAKVAAEKLAAEKAVAAEKAAAEKLAAERSVAEKLAAEGEAFQRALAEQAAAERAAEEKLAAEEAAAADNFVVGILAAEVAAAKEAAAEKAAAAKVAADKAAAGKAAAETATAEKTAAEKLAAEKLLIEKLAVEEAALQRAAAEQASAEKLVAEKRLAEKIAAERAVADKANAAKAAAEKAATDKLAAESAAAEKAAAEQTALHKAAAEIAAAEKALAEKEVAERTAAEKAAAHKVTAAKAPQDSVAAKRVVADNVVGRRAASEKFIAKQVLQEAPLAEPIAAENTAAEKEGAEKVVAEIIAADETVAAKTPSEGVSAENLPAKWNDSPRGSGVEDWSIKRGKGAASKSFPAVAERVAAEKEKVTVEHTAVDKVAPAQATLERVATEKSQGGQEDTSKVPRSREPEIPGKGKEKGKAKGKGIEKGERTASTGSRGRELETPAKQTNAASKGFGAQHSKPQMDGKVLLKRSEKDFVAIKRLSNEDEFLVRGYIVSARVRPGCSFPGSGGVADWVPCVMLSLLSQYGAPVDKTVLVDAVSGLTKEIFAALTLAMPAAKSAPPKDMQYGIETMESFEKYVAPVLYGSDKKDLDHREALGILGIDGRANSSAVRSAYRKLMFQLHPDRNAEPDAVEKLHRVQAAYRVLCASSMMTGMSWFESLGGSDRTFTGPLKMSAIDAARPDSLRKHVSKGNTFAAVMQINADITQFFTSRQRLG